MDKHTYDETSSANTQIVKSPNNTMAEHAEVCAPDYDSRALMPAEARQQSRPLMGFGMMISRSRSARSRR